MPTPTFLQSVTPTTGNTATSIDLDPHVDTNVGDLLLLLWCGAMTDTGDDDALSISTGWTEVAQETAEAGGRSRNTTIGYWWRVADGGANDTATVTKGDHDAHGGMLVTVQGLGSLTYQRQSVSISFKGDANPYTIANPDVNANEYGFAVLGAAEIGGVLGGIVTPSPWTIAGTNTNRPWNVEGLAVLEVYWVEGATSSSFDMDIGSTNAFRVSAVIAFAARRRRNRRNLGLRR